MLVAEEFSQEKTQNLIMMRHFSDEISWKINKKWFNMSKECKLIKPKIILFNQLFF